MCSDHRDKEKSPKSKLIYSSKKSPSDGHCQCEKETNDHLLACQQILEREPCSDMPY
jgi:hypothetical protein